ncbi:hypothetical protein P280DRAFT_513750 [Massarina eburnea CBS 473.64]|uniref:Uncharacterized protein n=1 Tax=Massarina eburnea CBS 473.64 TaxID=1395130 RepID=A0A6A6SGR0_9PLEO|nr:hypothetical protein P280DRAFT_513750 [Massarina eburnea CBS 473.64]
MDIKINLGDIAHVANTRFPAAYKDLPVAHDLLFYDISGVPSLLVGRLVLNHNGMKIIRDIGALVGLHGDRVGLGFTNDGAFHELKTWDTVNIQFCAPFALFDKDDPDFKSKFENFVKFCFLAGRRREVIVAGLEFMVDMKEIAEDVGWHWRMWKHSGGKTVHQFVDETMAAGDAMAHEYEAYGRKALADMLVIGEEALKRDREEGLRLGFGNDRTNTSNNAYSYPAAKPMESVPQYLTPTPITYNGINAVDDSDPSGWSEIRHLQEHIQGLRVAKEQRDGAIGQAPSLWP